MQRVPELVKHGAHIVEAEQRWLSWRRLTEVRHVEHHRLGSHQLRLSDERVHPRAAVLVVALEIIAIEQGQVLAVAVEYLEHAYIRLIYRKVLALLEGDPVKLISGIKYAILQHVVQLKIRFDLRFIQVVLR